MELMTGISAGGFTMRADCCSNFAINMRGSRSPGEGVGGICARVLLVGQVQGPMQYLALSPCYGCGSWEAADS
jgi:hypothetical protein